MRQSCPMLETLLNILEAHNGYAPEILLEEDGDICLDWSGQASISINPSGSVAWAMTDSREHGSDLNQFIELLGKAYIGRPWNE